MAAILFPNTGALDPAGIERMKDLTGYNLVISGKDLIIPDNDPSLDQRRFPVFEVGRVTEVTEKKYEEIADNYIGHLAEEYEAYEGDKPRNIPVFAKLGLSAELKGRAIDFFFSDREELRLLIIESICPFMKQQFNAAYSIPLRINGNRQQAVLSLGKISLLMQKFQSKEEVDRINFGSKSLESLLPHPPHFMTYADALLIHVPLVISLPFSRVASALHFLSDKPKEFVHDSNKGLLETLFSSLDPMTSRGVGDVLGKDHIGSVGQRRYFSLVIAGLNRFIAYLNDLRNYQSSDGTVDFQAFVQAHCAAHLIFTELFAINFANSSYIKQKLAFSIVDKIANLKRHLGQGREEESALFKKMFSDDSCQLVASILKHHGRNVYRKLGDRLSRLVQQSYGHLHSELRQITRDDDEGAWLGYLRTVRNAKDHGAFLVGGQFEKTFLTTDGSVPSDVVQIAFLLVFAMVLEPGRFLKS